jgi:hypothetical protein
VDFSCVLAEYVIGGGTEQGPILYTSGERRENENKSIMSIDIA